MKMTLKGIKNGTIGKVVRKVVRKKIDAILQLLRDNPTITRNDLAKAVGISPSAIQKHINRLKANNTIVRRGGNRGGFWEVLGK